jgi:hypothetical protein
VFDWGVKVKCEIENRKCLMLYGGQGVNEDQPKSDACPCDSFLVHPLTLLALLAILDLFSLLHCLALSVLLALFSYQ